MKIIDIKNTNKKKLLFETNKVLRNGGLIIFPTETTYGAGVDATNKQAVRKLLAYKTRREGKPFSIAVTDKKMASKYVLINDQAKIIIEQFLPGPVTVVCKALNKFKAINNNTTLTIAPEVASEFNTLGIRIPDYSLTLDIIEKFKKPITATSANGSGKKRPYSINDILSNLSNKQKNLIDLVLDAGELPHNEPSIIIDTTLSTPITLRESNKFRLKEIIESDDEKLQKLSKYKLQKLDNLKLKKSNKLKSQKYGKHIKISKLTNQISSKKIINLTSSSEKETMEIAGRLLLKNWNEIKEKGLIIALNGSLGTGKTIFTKGVAKFLNINEIIKSPTYTYIEEYDFKRYQTKGKMYHLDMWRIDNSNLATVFEMCERLEIKSLVKKNNVVIIEWFEQIANFFKPLPEKVKILKINLSQVDVKSNPKKRSLGIY